MISSLGFVTGFTDSELNHVHGYAIVKKNDLKVIIGGYLNDKLHGYCLTYMNGKIESLQHYEEGNKIDSIIIHKENLQLSSCRRRFLVGFDQNLFQKLETFLKFFSRNATILN